MRWLRLLILGRMMMFINLESELFTFIFPKIYAKTRPHSCLVFFANMTFYSSTSVTTMPCSSYK